MRILLVNKFIFPKGGAETYTFDVGKMLEEHGHEVQYFGLENEKNIVGNRVDSYVTNMDFSQGIKKTIQWYLDNREWWETIISGEYQNYYEKMYSNR